MTTFFRWIDDSQVMVKVTKIGDREKIIVNITELSPHGKEISVAKLNRKATNFALCHGAASTDHCVIRDYSTDRKATYVDGQVSVVHIRQRAYVFQGVGGRAE